MSKICSNCKTENLDVAQFCKDCGNKLQDPIDTQKVERKTNNGGFGEWWNNLSNRGRGAAFGSVCCLGIIIILAIGGFFTSDNTTSSTPSTFSNQYVSFTLPSRYVAVNQADSTNGFCDVYIFSGTPADNTSDTDPDFAGDIQTSSATSADPNISTTSTQIINTYSEDATVSKVTADGISGYQFVDSDPDSGGYYLYTPSNGLLLEMNTTQSDAFNTIKNSIVFK